MTKYGNDKSKFDHSMMFISSHTGGNQNANDATRNNMHLSSVAINNAASSRYAQDGDLNYK